METESSMKGGTLDDILHQAESLLHNVHQDDGLGDARRLALGAGPLRLLDDSGWAPPPTGSTAMALSEMKAVRLLGNKTAGFDLPPSLAEKLETLQSTDRRGEVGKVPSELHDATDMNSFLKAGREKALLMAIENTRDLTWRDSCRTRDSALHNWWYRRKQQIIHQLAGDATSGLDTVPDVLNIVSESWTGTSGDATSGPVASGGLNQAEVAYAVQLGKYLQQRRQGAMSSKLNSSSLYPSLSLDMSFSSSGSTLCELLAAPFVAKDGAAGAADVSFERTRKSHVLVDQSPMIAELWRFMLRLSSVTTSLEASFPTPVESRENETWQREVVHNAVLTHLEAEFLNVVRGLALDKAKTARVGGVPTTRSLARAYVGMRILPNISHTGDFSRHNIPPEMEDGIVDGCPVWPMIYVCMRCGDFKAALSIVDESRAALGEFTDLLHEYVDNGRSLHADSKMRVKHLYRRSIKPTTDPYKRVMYALIGCCEPQEQHPEVVTSIDDFLWIRLSQLTWIQSDLSLHNVTSADHHSYSEQAHLGRVRPTLSSVQDVISLTQLQNILAVECGETYFDAATNPFLFFKVLLLTLQFEMAVAFLMRFEHARSHALHLALVLTDSQLLNLAKDPHAQLVSYSDTERTRRLNITRGILMYTRKFEMPPMGGEMSENVSSSNMHNVSMSHAGNVSSVMTSTMTSVSSQVQTLRDAMNYYTFLSRIPAMEVMCGDIDEGDSHNSLSSQQRWASRTATSQLEEDDRGWTMFHQCITELALSTKEFTALFGHLDKTGIRKPGLVDEYADLLMTRSTGHTSREDPVMMLIGQVAQSVKSRGFLEEAWHLFELCGEWDAAVRLANQLLVSRLLMHGTELVPSASLEKKQRIDKVVAHAQHLATMLRRNAYAVTTQVSTLLHLLDVSTFFAQFANGQYVQCLQMMDNLRLLPTTTAEIEHLDIERLPEEIVRLVPHLLLTTMQVVRKLWLQAKRGDQDSRLAAGGSPFLQAGGQGDLRAAPMSADMLKARATALLAFTSKINFRLPTDVYNQLFQLEREML